MKQQEKAIERLQQMMHETFDSNDIFGQVAVHRAILAVYSKFPSDLKADKEFQGAIKSIENSTRVVAQMLGLHLSQKWDEYYRSLGVLEKIAQKNRREEWIAFERRVLKMRAVGEVHALLVKTYPKAMFYPSVARLFTDEDIRQM